MVVVVVGVVVCVAGADADMLSSATFRQHPWNLPGPELLQTSAEACVSRADAGMFSSGKFPRTFPEPFWNVLRLLQTSEEACFARADAGMLSN